MRITTVQAARKDQGNCESCGHPMPKGAGYRHQNHDTRPPNPKMPPSAYYGLTTAGLYVVGLLVEAGIWDDYQEMLARSIARDKTKVWELKDWQTAGV